MDSCSLPPCGAPAKDLWGTRPSEESKPQRAQNVAHCGRTLHVTVSAEKPGKEVKPKCHPRVAELRPQQGGGHPFGASNRAWWTGGRKASQESGEASEAQLFSTSTQSKGPPVTTKCHRRTCIPSLNMFEHVVATTNPSEGLTTLASPSRLYSTIRYLPVVPHNAVVEASKIGNL